MHRNKTAAYTLYFIFITSISVIGNEISRHESLNLLLSYFALFFSYFWLSRFESDRSRSLLALGILARLTMFFSLPGLSDDFYRFLWDGFLIDAGINPYAFLPGEALGLNVPGITTELYNSLNSPKYYTVYPPMNQLIFWLSVNISSNMLMSVNFMRFLMIIADVGAVFYLRKLLGPKNRNLTYWYFLNPLVILEFTGNLHFEGIMIFFLLGGLYYLGKNKTFSGGVWIGLSIAAKLIPLIFLPFLFWANRWKKGVIASIAVLVVVTVFFSPLMSEVYRSGFGSSIRLYFQSFEFNGSFYLIFREIGYWVKGYNIIQSLGPAMAKVSAALIILLAIWGHFRNWEVTRVLLFSLTVYLALSTTVHPWYILTLVPLGIISGYYFPIVWSFTIFFTYVGYKETGYEISVFWIVIEYLITYSAMTYEILEKRNTSLVGI